MNANTVHGIVIAATTAITIALVLWAGRALGRWFTRSVAHSFSEQVVDVMAPDMARLGNRLGQSIDELRMANTAEHRADQSRLAAVEERLDAVEDRLIALDGRLPHRPANARTRESDTEETT